MAGRWLIPDDWDGVSYTDILLCIPDSVVWQATVKGAVYLLSRVYNWQGDQVDKEAAAKAGMEILDSMSNCSSIVEAINSLKVAIAGVQCGCDVGVDTDAEDGEEGGDVPADFAGEPYSEPDPIPNRKCLAANYIHLAMKDTVTQLDLSRADQYGFAGLPLVMTIVGAVIGSAVAPVAGTIVGATIGAILGFATALLKVSFNLGLLLSSIVADEPEAVCTLYAATEASQAREDYLVFLQTQGATSLETSALALLMPNSLMNLLFFEWGDSADEIENTPTVTDCLSCGVPDPEDWVLIPNFRFLGANSPEGTLGTGTIDQEGGVFTITATERLNAPGNWQIALCTQAFLDAHPGDTDMNASPSGSWGGQISRDSACPVPSGSNFAKKATDGLCAIQAVGGLDCGPVPPAGQPDFQMFYHQSGSPFTMDFSITTKVNIC